MRRCWRLEVLLLPTLTLNHSSLSRVLAVYHTCLNGIRYLLDLVLNFPATASLSLLYCRYVLREGAFRSRPLWIVFKNPSCGQSYAYLFIYFSTLLTFHLAMKEPDIISKFNFKWKRFPGSEACNWWMLFFHFYTVLYFYCSSRQPFFYLMLSYNSCYLP